MSNKKYFSYVRVSTQRQGQNGTSLYEQQAAIERYSKNWDLRIVKCFEERETAAKQGRRVFLDMLKALRQGKAEGLIIHKIDRSARNLKDWAAIGDLIDSGVEVHFANESLDLNSRGGRLSADIQAVVAADYIRNLREEVKKGFYGRLKQGLYPMPAPIGYLDVGKGEPKRIDPVHGPLIRKTFELYSSGSIGLVTLSDRAFDLGLRNKHGQKVSENGLSTILHNPFYTGLIRISKTGQMFAGKHRPIIPQALFDKVQEVLDGKNIKKTKRHSFVFQRHIKCAKCGNMLIPEKQKTYVYYRCHTRNCTPGSINEAVIHKAVFSAFEMIRMSDDEYQYFKNIVAAESENLQVENRVRTKQIGIQIEQVKDRLSKLADAYVEQVFDKQTYFQKTNALLLEEKSLQDKLKNAAQSGQIGRSEKQLELFLELVNSAYLSYKIAKPDERRDLVKMMTSNFLAEGKSLSVKLENPFQLMANRPAFTSGGPYRGTTRTFRGLAKKLVRYFANLDMSNDDDLFCKYLISKKPPRKPRPIPTHSLAGV